MTVTLDWFVNKSGLNNIKFLVGENHKNNEIISVNILDNPDVLKWFKKNELILTTGYVIKDDEKLQRQTVRELKEIGCSALAIKIKRFFKAVPNAIIDEAQKVDFPIIELPFFYSFSEMSNTVFKYLYEQNQHTVLQEYDFISRLMDACFRNVTTESLLQQFSDYIKTPVLLMDLSYKIVNISITGKSTVDKLKINEANSAISNSLLEENSSLRTALLKIGQKHYWIHNFLLDNHSGYICLLSKEKCLAPEEASFIQKVLQIISFSCSQNNNISLKAEHGNFFMHFLLHNKNPKISELKNICNFYDFDYKKAWICTTYSLQKQSDREKTIAIIKNNLKQNIPDDVNIQFFFNYNLFSAFFFFAPDTYPLYAAKKVIGIVKISLLDFKKDIRVGISTIHNKVTEISLSFEESLQSVNNNATQSDIVTSYLHQIPLNMLNDSSNINFLKICSDLIKPLIEYDRQNNTELLETLRSYIVSGFNSSAAAKNLYLHRNTMLKRLNKIKELLSIDFKNIHENFLLYLALISIDINKNNIL